MIPIFQHKPKSAPVGAWIGAAALFLTIAGCGGGGGPKRPSATPTPTPTGTFSSGSCSTTYAPNYVSSVDLLHWRVFPLRVFFIQDSQLTSKRQDLAITGFNRWVSATNGQADYTVVDSANKANVTVKFFVFKGGPGDTLGTTTVQYTPSDNTIQSAKVELGITNDDTQDKLTAAHEYAHVLAISGHSPNEADLMFSSGNFSGQITPSDLNTVLTAYCGNFNHNTNALTPRSTEPTRTLVMH